LNLIRHAIDAERTKVVALAAMSHQKNALLSTKTTDSSFMQPPVNKNIIVKAKGEVEVERIDNEYRKFRIIYSSTAQISRRTVKFFFAICRVVPAKNCEQTVKRYFEAGKWH